MKTDRRIGKNKQRKPSWTTSYKPGQEVMVKHYSTQVPAELVRQRCQPEGTWVGKKFIHGQWTSESIIVERDILLS